MRVNTKWVLFYLFSGFEGFCIGFWVFFRKAVLQVGSARSQLFMPGFRHAHTLQLLKNVFGHSPPGECLENNSTNEQKHSINNGVTNQYRINNHDEYTS